MSSTKREVTRLARICLGFGTLAFCLAAVPAAFAQYPTRSTVGKDGTAVMLEDYANPPLSNATHSGANTAAIDYKLQLGRVSSMRAEPANARSPPRGPLSTIRAARSISSTRKQRNSRPISSSRMSSRSSPPTRVTPWELSRSPSIRPTLKMEILYGAHGESRIARDRRAGQHAALRFESHGIHDDRPGESAGGPCPS